MGRSSGKQRNSRNPLLSWGDFAEAVAKFGQVFTSVHIGTAVIAKFCDFMLSFYMRKIVPNYQLLNVIRRWKKLAGLAAGRK